MSNMNETGMNKEKNFELPIQIYRWSKKNFSCEIKKKKLQVWSFYLDYIVG